MYDLGIREVDVSKNW